MKNLLAALIVLLAFGCTKKGKIEFEDVTAKDTITTKTVAAPVVGADEDLHGCKASAGFTWSELKGACVQVFEVGTRLDPYGENTEAVMSAFIIFDGDRAELFLPSEKRLVLKRKSEGESFVNGDWQLIPWKGYVLKKDGKILYTGQ